MSLGTRFWQYERERFPLARYLPLVAVFSFSQTAYLRRLQQAVVIPADWEPGRFSCALGRGEAAPVGRSAPDHGSRDRAGEAGAGLPSAEQKSVCLVFLLVP